MCTWDMVGALISVPHTLTRTLHQTSTQRSVPDIAIEPLCVVLSPIPLTLSARNI